MTRRVLVTGGGGVLGKAICRMLLERGDQLRSYARGEYPELTSMGVEVVRGDLCDGEVLRAAVKGMDMVIHTAARPGVWGSYRSYESVNLDGTRNVLDACRSGGVGKLVYTSSPSVVHGGGDQKGITEATPYPASHTSHYSATKARAEALVMAANGSELHTVSLRPHLIWGPGDNHLIPRLIARARSGRLRRIGDGTNEVDICYIDNAAHAHLLAADLLESEPERVGGKTYFISQGEPVRLWDFVDRVLSAAGLKPLEKSISARAAWVLGAVCEGVYGALRIKAEPPMTRFVAEQLSTSHWYDLSAAQRDLGYAPLVTTDEGLALLGKSFK